MIQRAAMIRRLVHAVLAIGAVLASGVAPRVVATRPSAPPLLGLQTLDQSPRVALPAGFAATVDLATSAQFVRVVADDIDSDGDLDVVASIGTLELLVWENDGAGHFSRVTSSAHPELRAQPPAPAFDGDGLGSNRWIQNDHHRGAHLEDLEARADEGPDSPLSAIARTADVRYGPRVRSSRAPPVA